MALERLSRWQQKMQEYQTIGLSPEGHLMEELRQVVRPRFLTAKEIQHSARNVYVYFKHEEAGKGPEFS